MKQAEVSIQKVTMTRKRVVIIGGLVAVVAAFVLFSDHGVIQRFNLQAEQTVLEEKFIELRMVEDSLRSAIAVLQTDSTEIERLARERYGYVKANEEVFIIKHDTLE
jgi:cell division protein FtsB